MSNRHFSIVHISHMYSSQNSIPMKFSLPGLKNYNNQIDFWMIFRQFEKRQFGLGDPVLHTYKNTIIYSILEPSSYVYIGWSRLEMSLSPNQEALIVCN